MHLNPNSFPHTDLQVNAITVNPFLHKIEHVEMIYCANRHLEI